MADSIKPPSGGKGGDRRSGDVVSKSNQGKGGKRTSLDKGARKSGVAFRGKGVARGKRSEPDLPGKKKKEEDSEKQKPFAAFRDRSDSSASTRKSDRPETDRPYARSKRSETDKPSTWRKREDQERERPGGKRSVSSGQSAAGSQRRGERKIWGDTLKREDQEREKPAAKRSVSSEQSAIESQKRGEQKTLGDKRKREDHEREKPRGKGFESKNLLPPLGGVVSKSNQGKGAERRVKGEDQNTEQEINKIEVPTDGGMRLNKYLAHCGIASRRAADVLIMQGQVTVNGVVIQEMGHKVLPHDIVNFKGKTIKPVEKLVYYLLNKPRNVLTTSADERGRKTVLDILATKVTERVYPVGRLDRNTSGLILLTNDGELTKKLSHPSHKVPKIYHVTLDKNLSPKDMESIREGITLEDGLIKADSLHFMEEMSKRDVAIELHSGKNRIVRRIFESLGYEVTKLDRTYYAGLTKKNLPRGFFRPLTKEEVRMLKHFT